MDFHFTHLRWWPVAAALSVVAGSALAQNGAAPAGQAILFSTPEGDNAVSNTSAFAAPDSQPHDFSDQLQAPASLFNNKPPAQFSLSSGNSPISASQAQRLQKAAQDQKDWALLTPEEILGVTTPEKILDGDPQDKENQSPSERFLARQQTTATNSFYNNDPDSHSFFSRDRDDENAGAARLGTSDAAQFSNRFGSATPDNNPFAAQDQDSSWFRPVAPAMPKPDPEQAAAMDRFRQLLNSGSSAEAQEKSSGSKFLSSQQPLPDPNLEALPVVNRIGASFTPLTGGISKPMGLTPLPGITQPMVQPVVTPSWAPQPPPWLSQNPQPFTMPQRKF
jgi:hypothetical protein